MLALHYAHDGQMTLFAERSMDTCLMDSHDDVEPHLQPSGKRRSAIVIVPTASYNRQVWPGPAQSVVALATPLCLLLRASVQVLTAQHQHEHDRPHHDSARCSSHVFLVQAIGKSS